MLNKGFRMFPESVVSYSDPQSQSVLTKPVLCRPLRGLEPAQQLAHSVVLVVWGGKVGGGGRRA